MSLLNNTNRFILICICLITVFNLQQGPAQFYDDFAGNSLELDKSAINGWTFFSGDGNVNMNFRQMDGIASIHVDATEDKQNVWWALIKRCVSSDFDLALLDNSNHELRIESRIRVSHAPRRVNLHLNTLRTIDFHSHLMEFDIPDTIQWHTIRMTTRNFDAKPGDKVYGQLALMDWGLSRYRVDLDYFKVDIVNIDTVTADKGVQVPYHPPVLPLSSFGHSITVYQDCIIDRGFPDINFNNWYSKETGKGTNLLGVDNTKFVILQWDFNDFQDKKVLGSGLLELSTFCVQKLSANNSNFGMVRVVEIYGGDPSWKEKDITYNKFFQGKSVDQVLNPQMIIDIEVEETREGKNLITISNPVLQRLIDKKTYGLAILPLGAINAVFYGRDNPEENLRPKLHLNINSDSNL